jgi:hypothetical protein
VTRFARAALLIVDVQKGIDAAYHATDGPRNIRKPSRISPAFSPPGGAIAGLSFTSDMIQRFLRPRIGPARKETISRLR